MSDASNCTICGRSESHHSGIERFCPLYATYRTPTVTATTRYHATDLPPATLTVYNPDAEALATLREAVREYVEADTAVEHIMSHHARMIAAIHDGTLHIAQKRRYAASDVLRSIVAHEDRT
jgi:hypothetical protein